MRLSTSVLAAFACLSGLSSATSNVFGSGSNPGSANPAKGSSSLTCYSKFATRSIPWNTGTTTFTRNHPCTSTKTSVVTVTQTPVQVTSTVTNTVTTTSTASTTTSTAVSTVTSTSSVTNTQTSVTTSSVTASTVVTAASTVPAPVSFTPIQSSLPGSSYSGSNGNGPIKKRASRRTRAVLNPLEAKHLNGTSPRQYPAGVQCYKFQPSLLCSTSTISSTTTITASTPPPATVTSVTTVTTTTYPGATTTITSTVTTISSITSTETSTTIVTASTSTSTSYTTTVYAACATPNIADNVSGAAINTINKNVDVDDSTFDYYTGVATAYDCCVAVLLDASPVQVWALNQGYCFAYYGGSATTCDQNAAANQWSVGSTNLVAPFAAYGNSPCGEYV